jgi:hypothetical protein
MTKIKLLLVLPSALNISHMLSESSTIEQMTYIGAKSRPGKYALGYARECPAEVLVMGLRMKVLPNFTGAGNTVAQGWHCRGLPPPLCPSFRGDNPDLACRTAWRQHLWRSWPSSRHHFESDWEPLLAVFGLLVGSMYSGPVSAWVPLACFLRLSSLHEAWKACLFLLALTSFSGAWTT